MRKIKRFIFLSLILASALLLGSCANAGKYSLGSGNIGGNYHHIAENLSELSAKEDSGLSLRVRSTAGSAANLRLVQQGILDFAIVQSDMLMDAYEGTGAFSQLKCTGVRAVAGLYSEECQIVVRADSDIASISDLYGKKVSVGEEESGVTKIAEQILKVNGIGMDMVTAENMTFTQAAEALEKGNIDAAFFVSDIPLPVLAELCEKTDIRLISLDVSTVERIIKEYPCYTVCEIPADTYKGQTEKVTTVCVKAVLIAANDVPDDAVNSIMDTVFAHSSDLFKEDEFGLSFAVSGVPAPFHKAAAERYLQQGITVDTENGGSVGNVSGAWQD